MHLSYRWKGKSAIINTNSLMLFLYNAIQLIVLLLLAPVIACIVLFKPKYRGRIFRRLGYGFSDIASAIQQEGKRIWIHALSVGEVSSVRSLVQKAREEFPDATILFSSTTRSGEQHARATLTEWVDVFISFPIDIYWVALFFIRSVKPDLFVLVETDFWPNFFKILKKDNVPAVLVNGRMSDKAFANYRRFRFLFKPMFQSMNRLAVQRHDDVAMLTSIGVSEDKIIRLGNLKYDVLTPSGEVDTVLPDHSFSIPDGKIVWVAGSTHTGEEELLVCVCKKLQKNYPDFFLVIAPREIGRSSSIQQMAEKMGVMLYFRTNKPVDNAQGMILDTLGELASVYSLADLAFIGGSLVPRRGHNPLEPAAKGKPVLFGPHMEDFIDIVSDMLQENVAVQVNSAEEMEKEIRELLEDSTLMDERGKMASKFVKKRQGVTEQHIDLLRAVL